MNEKLLRALMELFAITANIEGITAEGRSIVKTFLRQQVTLDSVPDYLELFDHYLAKHDTFISSKKSGRKRHGLPVRDSTKALVISEHINAELTQKQKIVVLIRVMEFMKLEEEISEVQYDFVSTVASAFNVSESDFNLIYNYTTKDDFNAITAPYSLIVNNNKSAPSKNVKHIHSSHLEGVLYFLRIPMGEDIYVVKYQGEEELYLNGQNMQSDLVYFFANGSSIRSSKTNPIYYSDVVGKFLSELSETKISFSASNVWYRFKNGNVGLRGVDIEEESGGLLGFMGASGAGKTTLMNVMSGIETPSEGAVQINGIDIHKQRNQIEGVIGYVAQDDLLIEELTVYNNLYYNAKLCFGDLDDNAIDALVMKTLHSLGLAEAKDIKVGSPLNKKISGGQRKRLNIALELIREPSVLFVDEPTSGLSSRDSENIMDLLKELSLKGKLIFVVIHQPSSDIFKMFDKMYILDKGGYPIYYGNPVEAVIYFKQMANHVNADKSECATCGNINPEQIFNIIESKVIDEYGNFTSKRKISPQQWNEFFKENIQIPEQNTTREVPKSTLVLPNKLKQLGVFITRDVLAKIANRQYMLINFLEAPLLAFILAYLVKYFSVSDHNVLNKYIFSENENISIYIFMSVIVALFMGLTVSAEEIIKDQKIRKRETFLNLSKQSYLLSKVGILLTISAIQMFSYVLIGNYILEIREMNFSYWFALFSTAFFANMLGLNISASFNSAVTIYILIPIILIPQLLLSGAVVKFDKLHPALAAHTHVPVAGDAMASKWAFEALTVNQFINNRYEKPLYKYDKLMSIAEYRKNYFIPKLIAKSDYCDNHYQNKSKKVQQKIAYELSILKQYVQSEMERQQKTQFNYLDKLTPENFNGSYADSLKIFLYELRDYYIKVYNYANLEKDKVVSAMQNTPEKRKAYLEMKEQYDNENLSSLVRNSNTELRIIEKKNQLIQKIDPIYMDPVIISNNPFDFRAHFFAAKKRFLGKLYPTFWFNIAVLWVFSIFLYLFLSFDLFRKLLNIGEYLSKQFPLGKK